MVAITNVFNHYQVAEKMNSQEDENDDESLKRVENDFFALLGASRSNDPETAADKHYRWTGVVSTAHFAFDGCVENTLRDDVADAWDDIESILKSDTEPWQFVWNAKDHELPNSVTDLEQFRLSSEELRDLGESVTRLREH